MNCDMEARFRHDVLQNTVNAAILSRWQDLGLPNAWLVAGCLFQTVWNLQRGRQPGLGIKDYDLFYFNPNDLSEAAEAQAQARVNALLADLDATVEVAIGLQHGAVSLIGTHVVKADQAPGHVIAAFMRKEVADNG